MAARDGMLPAGEANERWVFAMEISPAYVAIERWQADTGRAAILDGDGPSRR